jgi:Trk K+ transport system NAD-binding subunit
VPNAKAVIVATSSDKVNLLVSQVIRSNFGDKRIVARANSTSNLSAFTEAGIETMSPIQATAAILENMVLRPSLFKLMAMKANAEDEHLDEIRVTSRKSVGNNLAKLSLRGCLVVAVRRDGKLVPPNGSTVLRYNDILTLLGDNKSLERAKRILQVAD